MRCFSEEDCKFTFGFEFGWEWFSFQRNPTCFLNPSLVSMTMLRTRLAQKVIEEKAIFIFRGVSAPGLLNLDIGQWENVGKYGLEETESFRVNFNPQSPPPKKEVKNEGRTKSLWSAHRVLCKLHCWKIWAAVKRFLELALSSSLSQLGIPIELIKHFFRSTL